jgi:hypothetical protein
VIYCRRAADNALSLCYDGQIMSRVINIWADVI